MNNTKWDLFETQCTIIRREISTCPMTVLVGRCHTLWRWPW